jgi:hypothetical protein
VTANEDADGTKVPLVMYQGKHRFVVGEADVNLRDGTFTASLKHLDDDPDLLRKIAGPNSFSVRYPEEPRHGTTYTYTNGFDDEYPLKIKGYLGDLTPGFGPNPPKERNEDGNTDR